jgi:GT2 family glycosyltransferase
MTDWNHLESRDVDQVMGSYLMIRNAFVKSYGLMDTRFFVFLEDADLCKRVWLNGGIVHYNSSISIIHEGGSSTDGISDKKTCYLLEGKLKYAYKYFEFWKYLLLFMMVVFIEPFSRVIFYLFKNPASIKDSLRGYLLFLKRHQFK